MLNGKDLRIGNLISVLGNVVEVIKIYGEKKIEVHSDILQFWEVDIEDDDEDVKPIPLTEEWLKKMGFFQLPHFTVMNSWYINLGRNRQLSIGSVGSPNCMAFIQEIGRDAQGNEKVDDIICLYNWDYDGQLYVHEVQNFYKCLTRLELEVK